MRFDFVIWDIFSLFKFEKSVLGDTFRFIPWHVSFYHRRTFRFADYTLT